MSELKLIGQCVGFVLLCGLCSGVISVAFTTFLEWVDKRRKK